MRARAQETVGNENVGETAIITGELSSRPSRPRDDAAVNRAMVELASALAGAPDTVLRLAAGAALDLCEAGSAGVCLLEESAEGERVHWSAIAGKWTQYRDARVARGASPWAGHAHRKEPVLLSLPGHVSTALQRFDPPATEMLSIPVFADSRVRGALWIVSHSDRHFDPEDSSILETLAPFVSVACRMSDRMREAEGMRAERVAALNLMEDAVAARKETERVTAALQLSEINLRTLANAVPQLIWTTSAEGAANYFNQRWLDYTGLSLADSIGSGWQAVVHPEDLAATTARWLVALESGTDFIAEYRLRGTEGKYRWFLGRNVPLRDENGRVASWIGTATDIQEFKEAESLIHQREEQFSRAIEHAPIPIIMVAEDGELWQVNRTWTELTGYAPEQIPTIDLWLDRACPDDACDVKARLQQVFADEVVRTRFEVRIRTRDGEVRDWIFTLSAPGTLRDGRRFAVGMAVDYTERLLVEQALRESEMRLRETDRLKNQFLAMLGHELRNPLAAIRGGMSLLMSGKTKEATRSATLPVVAHQVAHMQRLVDDMLDATRIVEGRLQVRRERVVLQQAVGDAIAMVRHALDEGGFEVNVSVPDAPLLVSADAIRLTQIFVNLLNNAMKYSGESRRIDVEVKCEDGRAQARVRDFGQGIPRELLPRIFDAFVQATPGTTLQSGLGLGLTVVRQLVALHDGRISAASEGPGTGAEFVISLPLLKEDA
jgi:PAS domain S-box-containing protein